MTGDAKHSAGFIVLSILVTVVLVVGAAPVLFWSGLFILFGGDDPHTSGLQYTLLILGPAAAWLVAAAIGVADIWLWTIPKWRWLSFPLVLALAGASYFAFKKMNL